jgi:hypothetical protein
MTPDEQIPLSLIRRHCKIDDYAGVSDFDLELYRSAAFEAFSDYTGLHIGGKKTVDHAIKVPRWDSIVQAARARIMVQLEHPSSDGVVVLHWRGKTRTLMLAPNATEFEYPWDFPRPWLNLSALYAAGLPDVANACASGGNAQQMPQVSYTTGSDKPLGPGCIIGCLKYIAWTYSHPGDELATVGDRYARAAGGNLQGSNNTIVASGAYAEWFRYKRGTAR